MLKGDFLLAQSTVSGDLSVLLHWKRKKKKNRHKKTTTLIYIEKEVSAHKPNTVQSKWAKKAKKKKKKKHVKK